jgi:hypothetical protein
MAADRLPVVDLVLDAAAGSVVDCELAGACWPCIIDIKLAAACGPIVHHKCAGCLGLGVAVGIWLRNIIKVIAVRILLLLLLRLLNNSSIWTTSAVVDVKLAWLSGTETHLEVLLADGPFVV